MTRKQDNKKHSEPFLPQEILFEILSWLTVKSLLSCKCVCKQWNAIIQDIVFVEMHMARNINSYCYSKFESETLNLDGVEETFAYVYTCDGLLLERSISSHKYRIRNPAIKQILDLPDPHKNSMLMVNYYNYCADTYRVLSIYQGNEESKNSNCEVLDLVGSDLSWRPLNISIFHDFVRIKENFSFLVIGDILHCIRLAGFGSSNSEIICLNLENEEVCSSVNVPRSFFSVWWDVKFLYWDGKPSLVRLMEEQLIVWVLEDYKIQKWADSKIVISLPFLQENANMKGLRPWLALEGKVYFHLTNVDAYFYHSESKLLQKLPEEMSYNRVANQATLVTLEGMRPEKKESRNEHKRVS